MSFENTPLVATNKAVIAALCLALTAMPLAACSGQSATTGADAAGSTAQASASSVVQTAALDTSSWKTMGDALAAQTNELSAGWDDDYYVCVFKAGDSVVRVVAKMTPDAKANIDAVDWSKDDASEKTEEALSPLELVSAEDLTSQLISQDELNKLVGKTGQELVNEGWTFQNYYMYGGEQTGATFVKEDLAYSFIFDVSISEDAAEDEGAAMMSAKLAEAEFQNAADAATDPSKVG